jgi:hypothetical protein
MNPGDQRLLHGANALAVLVAWGLAWGIGGEALASSVAMGAGSTAICIAGIGFAVRALTLPGPRWMKPAGMAAFLGQFALIGIVILKMDPDGGSFAAGVAAVLGATVVAALADGMKQSKQEGE